MVIIFFISVRHLIYWVVSTMSNPICRVDHTTPVVIAYVNVNGSRCPYNWQPDLQFPCWLDKKFTICIFNINHSHEFRWLCVFIFRIFMGNITGRIPIFRFRFSSCFRIIQTVLPIDFYAHSGSRVNRNVIQTICHILGILQNWIHYH